VYYFSGVVLGFEVQCPGRIYIEVDLNVQFKSKHWGVHQSASACFWSTNRQTNRCIVTLIHLLPFSFHPTSAWSCARCPWYQQPALHDANPSVSYLSFSKKKDWIGNVFVQERRERQKEEKTQGGFNLLSGLQVQDICHTSGLFDWWETIYRDSLSADSKFISPPSPIRHQRWRCASHHLKLKLDTVRISGTFVTAFHIKVSSFLVEVTDDSCKKKHLSLLIWERGRGENRCSTVCQPVVIHILKLSYKS